MRNSESDFIITTPHRATLSERASVFIADMSPNEHDEASFTSDSFELSDRPMAKTAVLIPVAAHQDTKYIIPTLQKYSHQRTDEPFTIFLGLNAPATIEGDEHLDEARNLVEQANQSFPELDIRSSATLYDKTTIGKIRRDLWNAAIVLAYREDRFSSDVIGINNDIDTHSISPHYISRVQQHYNKRRESHERLFGEYNSAQLIKSPSATRVSHAVLPSHPNTGMVTSWVDNTYFQSSGEVAYEAGLVIPFSLYLRHGGFDENAITNETSWMPNTMSRHYLAGAQMSTSPRRYIDRLRDYDTSEIWTEDSFGVSDNCRDDLPMDISKDRAEEVIFNRLQEDLECYWLKKPIHENIDKLSQRLTRGEKLNASAEKAKIIQDIEKQKAKAERLMRKLSGSAMLADLISSYDIDKIVYDSNFNELCR